MSAPPVLSFRPESKGGVRVDLAQLVAARLLIQANSGGGKSWALRYLCEQLHGLIQIIIIDPEGEFASLRERFPFLLAGADGDVPAAPKTAKLLARRLLELRTSAIVDLYDLKLDQRREFVRLFLDEVNHAPKKLWHPALLIVDEAHVFCPERGSGEASSTDAVITLCTQGRKKGFAAVLATQRLSKLHKDAAAELRNKLIGLTGLDLDQKRAGDELGFDKEQRLALRDLEPGTFWAFGPAIARHPTLVRAGDVATTHPKPGEIAPPAPPPPAAVKKMLEQMQGLEREAEAEARTIEDLQRQLAAAKSQVRKLERSNVSSGNKTETIVDERAIARAVAEREKQLRNEHAAQLSGLRKTENHLRTQVADYGKRAARAFKLLQQSGELVESISLLATVELERQATPAVTQTPAESSHRPVAQRVARATPPREPRDVAATNGRVTRPQQRILEVLAALQMIGLDQPDRSTVAVFADQSPRSSGYANNLGALRTACLIDYPAGGCVSITDDGMGLVGEIPEIGSLEELHEAWLSRVSAPQRRILEQLIEIYPESADKTDLAEAADQSPTSSGYANNLGFLRNSLGLIDYPSGGRVAATKRLFPNGLT